MDISIARQPIINKNQEVIAYEILYRGKDYTNNSFDGDKATIEVINNTILNLGFDNITGEGRAFFNFTGELIKQDVPVIFDKNRIVIEIVEETKFDEKLINKIKKLKKDGYIFALGSTKLNNETKELFDLVNIVKIDFLSTDSKGREKISKIAKQNKLTMIGEKIESYDEFNEAKELGCKFFQGFFFHKPEIIVKEDIKAIKSVYALLLKELNTKTPDYKKLAEIIKKDLSLTYKFLTLVNSVEYYPQHKIDSVHDALVRIGLSEINKYIYILLFKHISSGTPDVVTKSSILKGNFCELLGKKALNKNNAPDYFLAGLFSMIDAIFKKDKEEALEELPLSDDIKNAILEREENKYFYALQFIDLYEKGEFSDAKAYLDKLGIKNTNISQMYLDAVKKSNYLEETFKSSEYFNENE